MRNRPSTLATLECEFWTSDARSAVSRAHLVAGAALALSQREREREREREIEKKKDRKENQQNTFLKGERRKRREKTCNSNSSLLHKLGGGKSTVGVRVVAWQPPQSSK